MNDLDQQFLILQQQFIANLSNRKQRLTGFYAGLFSLSTNAAKNTVKVVDKNALIDLHTEAHNLAGTAGCYQLADLAYVSKQLENHLWSVLDKNKKIDADEAWQKNLYKLVNNLINFIDDLIEGEV